MVAAGVTLQPQLNPVKERMESPSALRRALLLALLALVWAGLNALKPLHIDDAALYYNARQASEHPLDPYGHKVLWYYEPQPANEILGPPVLPYTWAAARVLCGERPWLWKLALSPWCLLF